VLETCCEDALNTTGIGYSFKKNLDDVIEKGGYLPINWGEGVWQQILSVNSDRKECVHKQIREDLLFADVVLANDTIHVIRDAIKDIFQKAGKEFPSWVDDDEDKGWDKPDTCFAYGTLIHKGASESDPNAIIIKLVDKDREYTTEIFMPDTDYFPILDRIKISLVKPINSIRVYKGSNLIDEVRYNLRGN
jgi:hypothetical protein